MFFVLALAGGGQAMAAEFEAGLRNGDPSYLREGLNDAYDAFFPGGAPTTGVGGTGGGTSFGVGGSTPVTRTSGADVFVAMRQQLGRVGPIELEGVVIAQLGQRRYGLPTGIGIFTDPATITFQGATLGGHLNASLSWSGSGPGAVGLTLSARMGLEAGYIRTHVRSALIDRPAITRRLTPMLGVAAELQWRQVDRPTPFLRASAETGAARQLALNVSAGLRF